MRLLRQAFRATGLPPLPPPSALIDLESQVKRLGEVERRVLSAILGHKPTAQDPTRTFDARLTFGERVADRVAALGGSWTFIGLFAITLAGWIAVNDSLARPFDPYPYILLNLILSCLAALQAPVIMMSQNRQAVRDRIEARNDYEVNLHAELEIMSLHAKLDSVKEGEWAEILRVQQEQLEVLRRLEAAVMRNGSLD
jgi:uncharacterized membrane protein